MSTAVITLWSIIFIFTLIEIVSSQFQQDDNVWYDSSNIPSYATAKRINQILDYNWVLRSSYLVIFMQAGFSFLEAGMVRGKNTKNILFKNLITTALGAIFFFGLGYSFAFDQGKNYSNSFVACCSFFTLREEDYYSWVSKWAFSSIACTIINGSVSERTKMIAYLILNSIVPSIVYPLVAHWVWNQTGWLYQLGVIDYGGAMVVHILGGSIGLVGTIILGPRLGKFDLETGRPLVLAEHNIVLSSIGGMILWFTFYGLHPMLFGIDINKGVIASRGAISTTLSGSISMVTSVIVTLITSKKYDLKIVINGLLSGFVAASSCAGFIEPFYSIIIGVGSAIVYLSFSKMLLRYQVDDPCQSASVHLANGIWGSICASLFSNRDLVDSVYQNRTNYLSVIQGGFKLLFIQLIGIGATIIWCVILKRYQLLRIDSDVELTGMDIRHHGGAIGPYHRPS
ncbi:ammonium transporter [Cavenderia fasciculata]|uniref:Ammonium transporter n=1 Tax=Cavenderia fasciculata TaxID=261658 RepID=F4QEM8_CACFS|nr:ammonium transporter [Cavenderia fasciculata]EGG14139.1 ammonium transporter [Cavenderia fasciculata]|eukprot:XP_004350847.1 ammonium transporter [Cavenderia fasciculata]